MSNYIPIGDAVIWNDHHLVVFNKPNGIPVQPDQTGDPSLLQLGSTYCKQKLELVHRLDRPVSGVVAFAKRKDALQELHRQFRARQVQKTYLAITAQTPPQAEGELIHYQRKVKGRYRAEMHDTLVEGSVESRLRYRLLGKSDRYFLWQIELLTGRYHQIRAQLAHIGCPIRGDAKYGFRRRNPDRGIDLHAWQLSLQHPRTRESLKLIAPPSKSPLWDAFGIDYEEVW